MCSREDSNNHNPKPCGGGSGSEQASLLRAAGAPCSPAPGRTHPTQRRPPPRAPDAGSMDVSPVPTALPAAPAAARPPRPPSGAQGSAAGAVPHVAAEGAASPPAAPAVRALAAGAAAAAAAADPEGSLPRAGSSGLDISLEPVTCVQTPTETSVPLRIASPGGAPPDVYYFPLTTKVGAEPLDHRSSFGVTLPWCAGPRRSGWLACLRAAGRSAAQPGPLCRIGSLLVPR